MFDQTFVDGTQKTNKTYTIVLSSILQATAICLLILTPLLYTQILPGARLKSILTAPSPPSAPKPLPVGTKIKATTTALRTLRITDMVAPRRIPHEIARMDDAPVMPDTSGLLGTSENAGNDNPLLFGSTGPATTPAPPPPRMPTKKVSGPVRVGGIVAEANLIRRVQPVYPPLAKSARVQGVVEFTAMISKEGRVEKLQLVSGHPLLVTAAREAILAWQYRPTMLNGEPVEVLTTILVNFRLSE